MLRIIITGIALLSFIVGSASATSYTEVLQPGPADGKDAIIWELYPDTNYGDLELGFGYDDGWLDVLIQFTELDAYIGTEVISATLELYVWYAWEDFSDDNSVLRIADNWDEDTVTWNTNPSWNPDIALPFDAPPDSGWFSINVTPIVET